MFAPTTQTKPKGRLLKITDKESNEPIRVRWFKDVNPTDSDIEEIVSAFREKKKAKPAVAEEPSFTEKLALKERGFESAPAESTFPRAVIQEQAITAMEQARKADRAKLPVSAFAPSTGGLRAYTPELEAQEAKTRARKSAEGSGRTPSALGPLGLVEQGLKEEPQEEMSSDRAAVIAKLVESRDSDVAKVERDLAGGETPAARMGRSFATGAVGSIQGMVRSAELVGIDAFKPAADKMQAWVEAVAPEDPNFMEQIASGAGSQAAFLIPGAGAMKFTELASRFAPTLASGIGATVSTLLESSAEAGSVYQDALALGYDEEKAQTAGEKTFWANVLLVGITNKLGVFGDQATQLKAALMSAPLEGLQESGQQVISNVNTGRDPYEGVLESGAIGVILGGGAGAAMGGRAPKAGETVVPETGKVEAPPGLKTAGELQKQAEPPEPVQPKVKPPATQKVPANPQAAFRLKQLRQEFESAKKEGKQFSLAEKIFTPQNAELFKDSPELASRLSAIGDEARKYNKPIQRERMRQRRAEKKGKLDIPALKKVVEASGAQFIGTTDDGGRVLFNDPQTGSTLSLPPDKLTVEAIQARFQESRATFPAKGKSDVVVTDEQVGALKEVMRKRVEKRKLESEPITPEEREKKLGEIGFTEETYKESGMNEAALEKYIREERGLEYDLRDSALEMLRKMPEKAETMIREREGEAKLEEYKKLLKEREPVGEIKKVKDFKTDEGAFSTYDVAKDVRGRADMFTVLKDKGGYVVRNALVPEEMRRKGVASKFYKQMNEESIRETGNPLRSTQPRKLVTGETVHELSPDAVALWESFVKKGIAEKIGDKNYRFKLSEEKLPPVIEKPGVTEPLRPEEGEAVRPLEEGEVRQKRIEQLKAFAKDYENENDFATAIRQRVTPKELSELGLQKISDDTPLRKLYREAKGIKEDEGLEFPPKEKKPSAQKGKTKYSKLDEHEFPILSQVGKGSIVPEWTIDKSGKPKMREEYVDIDPYLLDKTKPTIDEIQKYGQKPNRGGIDQLGSDLGYKDGETFRQELLNELDRYGKRSKEKGEAPQKLSRTEAKEGANDLDELRGTADFLSIFNRSDRAVQQEYLRRHNAELVDISTLKPGDKVTMGGETFTVGDTGEFVNPIKLENDITVTPKPGEKLPAEEVEKTEPGTLQEEDKGVREQGGVGEGVRGVINKFADTRGWEEFPKWDADKSFSLQSSELRGMLIDVAGKLGWKKTQSNRDALQFIGDALVREGELPKQSWQPKDHIGRDIFNGDDQLILDKLQSYLASPKTPGEAARETLTKPQVEQRLKEGFALRNASEEQIQAALSVLEADVKYAYPNLSLDEAYGKMFADITRSENVPDNALFQYIGENANLKEDIRSNLNYARYLESQGANQDRIRMATGWGRNPFDNKWRFEIPTENMKLKLSPKELSEVVMKETKEGKDRFYTYYKLSDIVEFPEFFRAYPQMKDITVNISESMPNNVAGSMQVAGATMFLNQTMLRESKTTEDLRKTIVHEMQHAVQFLEGFARGGNLRKFLPKQYDDLLKKQSIIAEQITKYEQIEWVNNGFTSEQGQKYADLAKQFQDMVKERMGYEKGAMNDYLRTAGEIESRDVEARMNMTPEQRRNIRPYSSEHISPDQAIVLFDEASFEEARKLKKPEGIPDSVGKPFKGKAYRVDSGFRARTTAQAVIDFEENDLGNKGTAEVAKWAAAQYGVDLSKLSSDNIVWVTRNKKVAEELYGPGEVEEQELPENSIVLNDIGEDGVLVLKGDAIFEEARKAVTDSPAFKKWFGGSKVVDESGEPLVVYHGTTASFDEFSRASRGRQTEAPSSKMAFFFSKEPETAEGYTDLGAGRLADQLKAKVDAAEKKAQRSGKNSDWDIYADLVQKYEEAEADNRTSRTNLGANVIPVYLAMKNPLVHDFRGSEYREESYADLIREAKAEGHDGVIFKNTYDPGTFQHVKTDVYAVFSPTQIKSATGNRGTFDPNDPNITMSIRGAKSQALTAEEEASLKESLRGLLEQKRNLQAQYDFAKSQPHGKPAGKERRDTTMRNRFGRPVPVTEVVNLTYGRKARALFFDIASVQKQIDDIQNQLDVRNQKAKPQEEIFGGVREKPGQQTLFQQKKGAVQFLEDGRAIIHAFEAADVSTMMHELGHVFRRHLKPGDLKIAEDWAGVKDGAWTRESEEKFARGFERYLAEGKAPTEQLKEVFAQFKKWLLDIYTSIKGSEIDIELSPEITKVFDRMMGGSEIRTSVENILYQDAPKSVVESLHRKLIRSDFPKPIQTAIKTAVLQTERAVMGGTVTRKEAAGHLVEQIAKNLDAIKELSARQKEATLQQVDVIAAEMSAAITQERFIKEHELAGVKYNPAVNEFRTMRGDGWRAKFRNSVGTVPPIAGGRKIAEPISEGAIPPSDIFTDGYKSFTLRNLISLGEYVKQQGGESGRLLVRDINRDYRESAQWAGRLEKRIRAPFKAMNTAEWEEFVILADQGGITDNAKVKEALRAWDDVRKEIGDAAVETGLETVSYDKAKEDFVKIPFRPREHFFPHQWDITDIKKQEYRDKFVDAFAEKLNMPKAKAEDIFNRWIRSRIEVKYGNLEHARDFDAPDWKRTRDVIPSYIERATRRIMQAQIYGPKYNIADNWIEQIRQNGGDYKAAQLLFDRVIGRDSYDRTWFELTRRINSWQAATKLTLLATLNWTQLNNGGLIAGWRSFARTIGRVFTSKQELADFADYAGAVLNSTLNMHMRELSAMEGVAGKVMRLTGVTAQERFMRALSADMISHTVSRDVKKLAKDPGNTRLRESIQRKLNYLELDKDIDLDKAIKAGGLTEAQRLDVGYEGARKTQFLTRPQDVPQIISNKNLKMFTLFKSFITQQTKLVKDTVIREARHGNFRPLLFLLILFPAAGELAQDLRSFLTGRERPDDLLDRYFEDLATVGVFGIVYDMFRAAKYDEAGLEKWLAGPTVQELSRLAYAITYAMEGETPSGNEKKDRFKPLKQFAIRQIPIPVLQQQLLQATREEESKGALGGSRNSRKSLLGGSGAKRRSLLEK